MTPVAMAMNFGTKIDYNSAPVKDILLPVCTYPPIFEPVLSDGH